MKGLREEVSQAPGPVAARSLHVSFRARRHYLPALFAAFALFGLVPALAGRALPDLLSAPVAFALLGVFPGWSVARLTSSRARPEVELLALSVPLSVAVLAPLALLAFVAGLSMTAFVALGLAAGFVLTVAASFAPPADVAPGRVAFLAVPLFLAASPIWLQADISRDPDDWWYLGYVRQYSEASSLAPRDPLSTSREISARTALDVWLVEEGAVARLSGTDPVFTVQEFLPPLMFAAALVAAYALTLWLFGDETTALAAALSLLAMSLLDVGAHEGVGRSLLVRTAQDKVVGGFVAVPGSLLLLLQYLRYPGARAVAGLLVAAVALVVIHPHALVIGLAGAGGLLLLEVLAGGRQLLTRHRLPLVGAVALGLVVVPAVAWLRLAQESPLLFNPDAGPRLPWRLIDLPAHLYMANPGLLRNPLLLLAVALSLRYIPTWRESRSSRFVLAATWTPILLIMFPPTAVIVGRIMAPVQLWRMLWLIPAAPTLGAAAAALARRFPSGRTLVNALAVVLALLGAGAVLQEFNALFDAGYFAVRGVTTNAQDLFAVQGLDYLVSGDQRLTRTQETTLAAVARTVGRRRVVLGDLFMIRALPAFSTRLQPFTTASAPRTDPAVRDMGTFVDDATPLRLRRAVMAGHHLTWALVPADSAVAADLVGAPGVGVAYRNAAYVLLQVRDAPRLSQPLAQFNGLDLWEVSLAPGYLHGQPGVVVRSTWTAREAVGTSATMTASLVDAQGQPLRSDDSVSSWTDPETPFRTRRRVPADVAFGTYRLLLHAAAPGVPDAAPVELASVTLAPDPDPPASGHEAAVTIARSIRR